MVSCNTCVSGSGAVLVGYSFVWTLPPQCLYSPSVGNAIWSWQTCLHVIYPYPLCGVAAGVAWFSAASLLLPAALSEPVVAAGLALLAVLLARMCVVSAAPACYHQPQQHVAVLATELVSFASKQQCHPASL